MTKLDDATIESRLHEMYGVLTTRTDYSERPVLSAAVAESDAPWSPRRRIVVWAVAAGTVLVIAGIAIGVLVASGSVDGGRPRSIVANGGDGGAIVDVPPPDGVGSDWKTLEYGGVRLSFPPTWSVLPSGECPGRDASILLGAAGRDCARPTNGRWVWIAPASVVTRAERQRCLFGLVGELPSCLALPADGTNPVERNLIEGTDLAIVAGTGARSAAEPVLSTLRSTDASAAARRQPSPSDAAQAFVDAYVNGACSEVRALAVRGYDTKCPAKDGGAVAALPNAKVAKVVGGQGWDPSDGYVRVTLDDQRAYEIQLRYEWSDADHRGEWKVVQSKRVDPATPFSTVPFGQPECIPVGSATGASPGCVHRDDYIGVNVDGRPQDPKLVKLVDRYGGIPVYKNATSKKAIGVIPASPDIKYVPFVPNRLIPKMREIDACMGIGIAHQYDATNPDITQQCRTLLGDLGIKLQ